MNTVRRLVQIDDAAARGLAEVLLDCVQGGASVGFMWPLAPEQALGFWQRIGPAVAAGDRALLVAEDAHGIVGTVQLVLAQPDNQPHRADLAKMLVHRRGRCRGVGAALMQAAEALARECGKSLLVLDTASAEAERLYRRAGWVYAGEIPGFALAPEGGLCATRLYYRQLPPTVQER